MNTRRISYLGVLVSLAVALNFLESLLPSPLPWVRLGLANVLTLVAILTCGWKEGMMVTLMRVVITSLLLGGFISPSFLMSLGGGIASTAVMAMLAPGVWRYYSPLSISVAGAFVHGLAQVLVLYAVLIRSGEVFLLLPWVLVPASLSGIATGLLANLVLSRGQDHFVFMAGGAAEPVKATPVWTE